MAQMNRGPANRGSTEPAVEKINFLRPEIYPSLLRPEIASALRRPFYRFRGMPLLLLRS